MLVDAILFSGIEGELAGVMLAAGKSKSLRGLTIARLQGRRQSATPIVQVILPTIIINNKYFIHVIVLYLNVK